MVSSKLVESSVSTCDGVDGSSTFSSSDPVTKLDTSKSAQKRAEIQTLHPIVFLILQLEVRDNNKEIDGRRPDRFLNI